MGAALTVPYPYDVVINDQGYVFADTEEQKAVFGLSPIFVSRQNTQGDYGDNQQDFWLSWVQKDWSGGEQARYEARGEEPQNRYWAGTNVDVRRPGQVAMRADQITPSTFAANPVSVLGAPSGAVVWVCTSTNLYHVNSAGTITSDGAHGLGVSPSRYGMAWDGSGDLYISSSSGGSVGVRKWDGAAFSTFSAGASDSLAFLNNTLYGFTRSTGSLYRFSAAGVATLIFTWQGADGTAITGQEAKLVPFGGKLVILVPRNASPAGAELWLYDGTAPAKIAELPPDYVAIDVAVLGGTIFVSGGFNRMPSGTNQRRSAIFFYKDGQQDLLWESEIWQDSSGTFTNVPSIAAFNNGLVWSDITDDGGGGLALEQILFYNALTGGVSGIGPNRSIDSGGVAAADAFFLLWNSGGTQGYVYPATSATATTKVYHSLVDFDTSLRKIFRGVAVEYDSATDGDGGSVDISYRFDNIDSSSYTSLQTSAGSGAEYTFPVPSELTTYQSVSILITLNKGTSTSGPKLKRLKVRAIRVQPAFKKREYTLLLSGRNGKGHAKLRDDTDLALDGLDQAANLQAAASKTAPLTIKDHLSTSGFTGVIEELKMFEYKPEQFIARVAVRQV